MARASWAVPPCCANAAVESVRADTAPMISVRNIGSLHAWFGHRKWFAGALPHWLPDEPARKSSLNCEKCCVPAVGINAAINSRDFGTFRWQLNEQKLHPSAALWKGPRTSEIGTNRTYRNVCVWKPAPPYAPPQG